MCITFARMARKKPIKTVTWADQFLSAALEGLIGKGYGKERTGYPQVDEQQLWVSTGPE
ncbi:hypothetical protein [Pseudomonas mediterranea]|uniref:hypothetical protein n=1 Tax=Pseudomonas mediterranea TaxID=183795 RepID=UPI000A768780|nr:hypothetical protein [Pseudomonas mediterranea]MDU9029114.1 hypothetical protein [Pseudomonas mediterranea]